jgi:hypothetical protein
VSVFDPLAVILLLASQYSFQWFRNKNEAEGDSPVRIQETEQPTVTKSKQEPYVQGDDGFKFLAEYDDLHVKYPATEQEADELAVAKQQAKDSVINKSLGDIKTEMAFIKAVDAGVYTPDGRIVTEEFAPPGTPGEAWAISEQQPNVADDKIVKANKDELLKQKRSRGWFQAVFPKRDDTN